MELAASLCLHISYSYQWHLGTSSSMAVVVSWLKVSPTLAQKTCNTRQLSNAIINPQSLWRSKQLDFHDQNCTYGPIVQCEHGVSCCNDENWLKKGVPCEHCRVAKMFHLVYQQGARLKKKTRNTFNLLHAALLA